MCPSTFKFVLAPLDATLCFYREKNLETNASKCKQAGTNVSWCYCRTSQISVFTAMHGVDISAKDIFAIVYNSRNSAPREGN